ncbi:unnamed protein product [Phaeothamnion confervicola]
MAPTGAAKLWGRLRVCSLVWLLSSSEAISVYGSVSVAAAGADGRGGAQSQPGPAEASPAGRALGAIKALFRRAPATTTVQGISPAECCAGPKCLSAALSCRGGHSGHSHVASAAAAAASSGGGASLHTLKLASMVLLTSLNVLCWYLPLRVKRFTESKTAVGVANAFSGGVFLSLAFGHMLPHACHGFRDLGYSESLPYFLTLGGYMLIFFVEKVAFDTHTVMHDGGASDGHSHSHGHSHGHGGGAAALTPAGPSTTNGVGRAGGGNGGAGAAAGHSSGRSALILLAALSVHSVFETMALGLSDTALDAGLLAMSIGLHTPAEAIALLVSFLRSGLNERQIIFYLGLFSCVAPLGVVLGMFVNEFAGKLTDATLVALTAGTFVYVGATEVVAEEFEEPDHRWTKFLALLGGCLAVSSQRSAAVLLGTESAFAAPGLI